VSLYGLTKKTKFNQLIKRLSYAEVNAVMMYNSLAQIALEQGYKEISDELKKIANQDAVHAGFYATLNGNYSKDFWELLCTLYEGESNGADFIEKTADELKAEGLTDAADIMKFFAKQGRSNSKNLKKIIEKYKHKEGNFKVIQHSKIVYRCTLCGYKYNGDINFEYDDYVCPICGQHKEMFELVKK